MPSCRAVQKQLKNFTEIWNIDSILTHLKHDKELGQLCVTVIQLYVFAVAKMSVSFLNLCIHCTVYTTCN